MEQIGRYEIREVAGRGGMSTVYRAFDPRFRREVAVKVMTREILEDQTMKERFTREAQIIAALEHPAIVPVYDFGEDEGRPYLIMRLMSGGTLADLLKNGALSIEETAAVLLRIGSALQRAHEQGVIHRDLKPSNIMFDQYGEAFLADFGIARLTSGVVTLTGDNVVGTPAYMSPEQIHGDQEIDYRSDIYALGVICFEMLTGRRPYQESDPMRLMMQHLLDPVPDIRTVRPDLPPELETVITHTMAKSPDDRYRSATELTDTLAALAGISSAAKAAAVAEREVPPPTAAPPIHEALPMTGAEAAAEVDQTIPDSAEQLRPPLTDEGGTPAAAAGQPPKRSRRIWLAAGIVALLLLILGGGGLMLMNSRANPRAIEPAEAGLPAPPGEVPEGESAQAQQESGREPAGQAEVTEPQAPPVQPTVDALMDRFYSSMDAEDYAAAEEAINEALALAPDQARLHKEKAWLVSSTGDDDLALAEVGKAIALDPHNGEYLGYRGDLLMERGEPEEALASHLDAVHASPEDASLRVALGDNYMALDRPQDALEQFSRAVELNADEAWLYNARAYAYFAVGDKEHGLADLERASELEPTDRSYFTQAADFFLYEQEDPQQALEYYQRAVERTPDDGWVYADRALAYEALGNVDAALADLGHAIELGPEPSTFLIRRAQLYLYSVDDPDAALADLNHAVEADPENPDAYAERAGYYQYYAEDLEAALADRTRALELEADGPWRYSDRALVYRALERDDEALADLEQCLNIDPEYYWCWWERGWLFDKMGEQAEATVSFQRFLELITPDDCPECQAEAEQYVQDNS